jgi:hypothetical protein
MMRNYKTDTRLSGCRCRRVSRKWATKEEIQSLWERIDTLEEHMNFLLNSKEMTDNEMLSTVSLPEIKS